MGRMWCRTDPKIILSGKPIQIDVGIYTDPAYLPGICLSTQILVMYNPSDTCFRDPNDTELDAGGHPFFMQFVPYIMIPSGSVQVQVACALNPEPGSSPAVIPPLVCTADPLPPSLGGPQVSSGMVGAWTTPVLVTP